MADETFEPFAKIPRLRRGRSLARLSARAKKGPVAQEGRAVKPQADHQLCLPLSGSPAPRMVKTTRAANKKRVARIASIPLPIRERRFLPVAGVPKTRADCPTER